ncbi:MAG: hypothetical protein HY699_16705 [Deltaproteobacteria bacterium]|nr:hypothetical protein [Deltaproteobacteria bacterium]
MMRFCSGLVIGLLAAMPALAADPPHAPELPKEPPKRAELSPPLTHNSACSLAESMAAKLGYKHKPSANVAQSNCQALAPDMKPADKAEFVRCCIKQLTGAEPVPGAREQPKDAPKAAPKQTPKKAAPSI